MGAREHGRTRTQQASGPSPGIGLKCVVAAHARSFLPTTTNSPTESEGTEFFDAHEEIPWTPDRPIRRSPAGKAARRRTPVTLWPERGSSAIAVDNSSSGSQQQFQPDHCCGTDKDALVQAGGAAPTAPARAEIKPMVGCGKLEGG